jgi:hypothetical protein
VSAGFDAVQDAFADNFSRRHELGGACCVYYRGQKVVDLSIPNSRLATLASPSSVALLLGFPIRLTLASLNRRSNIYRALIVNPGAAIAQDEQRIYARNLEVPSGGGVGTARAIACAYSVFATDGRELQLRPDTLKALSAPAIPATHGFFDECLMGEIRFSLGFMKPSPLWPFGTRARSEHLDQAVLLASPIRRPASATRTSPTKWGQRSQGTRGTSRCETRCTQSFHRHHRL